MSLGTPHYMSPAGSPRGHEIFFRVGESMMAATVQAGATFAPGEVREPFRTTATGSVTYPNYDVTRDGQSFIMMQPTTSNDQTVVVLLNWVRPTAREAPVSELGGLDPMHDTSAAAEQVPVCARRH